MTILALNKTEFCLTYSLTTPVVNMRTAKALGLTVPETVLPEMFNCAIPRRDSWW